MPDARDELSRAKAMMAARAWQRSTQCASGGRSGSPVICPLSLNAIAKGFIVERACDAAHGREVPASTGVMLNVGGDLRTRGGATSTA